MATELDIIREISDRLVAAQSPIRILDSIKWGDEIKQAFFASQCQQLPTVDAEYYERLSPFSFDLEEKIGEFRTIVRDCQNQLGQYTYITQLIKRRCDEYCKALYMLKARGTSGFSQMAMELYGAPDDAFYPSGPKLCDLGELLHGILNDLIPELRVAADEKKLPAAEAVELLGQRLAGFFHDDQQVVVKLSDNIVADAAAGADCIKLNQNVMFSERDLRYLEVHEGWVHVGTTLNGGEQPYCTFLAKGSPSSTVTQEGLAVITEIFSFSSYPARLLKLSHRVKVIDLVNQGANFIDIFNFYRNEGYTEDDAYNYTVRVFRGSTAEGGPFTKDLSYTKGFILIYNFIRLAVQKAVIQEIPLLFVGKTVIEEMSIITQLAEQKIIVPPKYLPPQFEDLSAITAWMSFSLYLNKFDLNVLAKNFSF